MSKAKVLFFAADPLSAPPDGHSARLRLDEEVRQIRQRVRAAGYRDDLEFDVWWAVQTRDLLQALNETHPQVVHFSGHGGHEGLVLVGSNGCSPHYVDAGTLAQLFQGFRRDIGLVVLNACFSLPQARAIADVVGCAIGTGGGISDEAAITFGASFYSAIAFGCSVQAAYDQARAALALDHFDDRECPQLVPGPDVDPAQLFVLPRDTGSLDGTVEVSLQHQLPPLPAPPESPSSRWVKKTVIGLGLAGAAVIANLPPWPEAPCSLSDARAFDRAGNDTAAFSCFKRVAKDGDREAMGFIGVAYLYGQGTERRPEVAITWLRKAARKRDLRSMIELAAAYQNGDGVKRSLYLAEHWFRAAAVEKRSAKAMRMLGSLYRDELKYDSARIWYQNAARAGSLDAMIDGGRMYENGVGTPRNLEEARRLYRTAAEAGLIPGMLEMGRIYQNAIGVPQDYGKARAWYEKAAAAGSGGGMNNLGILYQFGWGVQKDREAALQWYRRAIHAGSTTAAANLRKLEAG